MSLENKRRTEIINKLKDSTTPFQDLALEIFEYQFAFNPIYQRYCLFLEKTPDSVGQMPEIPFLPISFFKEFKIQTGSWEPQVIFQSSGTSGMTPSEHLLRDKRWYSDSSVRTFETMFGLLDEFAILALLPSYLEKGNSSLVFMVEQFMKRSANPENGFFLHDTDALISSLKDLKDKGQKTLLIGVSYALLDLKEKIAPEFDQLMVVETGG
ncbi:MAG: acyl transferase, partial [Saprospiraceae bacterium]|nr:acyl transferase [Saprospiraceae bacterium]